MKPRRAAPGLASLLIAAAVGLFPPLAAAANAFTQPYLMALDVCGQDGISGCILPGHGAGAETVYLLQSSDGVTWTKVPGLTPYEGAVPAVLRRGNTIYLVSMTLGPPPGYELRRYHMDLGTWEGPLAITISDSEYPGSPNSPALILDPQGRIALLSDTDGQCKRSTCDTVHQRITTEIAGSDGTQFLAQPDDLVATPLLEQDVPGIGAADATITFDGTRYVLSIGTNRRINPIMGSRLFTSANVYGPYAVSTAFPNGVIAGSGITTFYNAARQQYWHYSWLPAPSLYRTTAASLDIAIDTGDFVPANSVVTSMNLSGNGALTVQHPHFATNWSGSPTVSATASPRSLPAATGVAANATVTLTNDDVVAAGDCFVAPITAYPGSFSYQATNPASAPPNTPVVVAAGVTQTFTISFTTTEAFTARDVALRIGCASSTNAPVASGVNTITITSTGSAIRNYEGMWWSSPPGSENGWGVNLTQQGDLLFATWFTYDTDGSALWFVMSSGQRNVDGSYSGQLHRATGPPFNLLPYDSTKFVTTLVGSATFTFADANNGTFAYTVNGVTQSKPITRYVFASPVPNCTAGTSSATNYQDMWWKDPPGSENGWGVNIMHQGDTLFATWFTYDGAGKPLWFVMSSGARTGDRTYSGQIHRATGAAFSATPWNPALFTPTLVGSGTFDFADGSHGLFSYTVNGLSQAKPITRYVFSTPATRCQ